MPNFGPPSTPRPAASIVLLRRGGKHSERALELLLLKRSEEAKFMPGVWVFPGGSLDEEVWSCRLPRTTCAGSRSRGSA